MHKTQLFNFILYSPRTCIDTPVIVPPMYTSAYTLHNIDIIESEVLTIMILNSLDVNKAAGIDNISPVVL